MKKNKPLMNVLSLFVVASTLSNGFALNAYARDAAEFIQIDRVQYANLNADKVLAGFILEELSSEVSERVKLTVATWFSQGLYSQINPELGILNAKDKVVIQDLSQKDLTATETAILDLLINLHKRDKLIPFLISLLENLKTDPNYAQMVSGVTQEQKDFVFSMISQTIESTDALRNFDNRTWTELSKYLDERLDRMKRTYKDADKISSPDFESALASLANTRFTETQNTQLLVDGPASFSLRDKKIAEAKESINMITWAVIDDATGSELADLLIKKHQSGVSVRLIVDGQVAMRSGYRKEVSRLEKAGVQVIRWFNSDAKFMGQHRKILIIDEDSVITGGMNPGDSYSHKAGSVGSFWRDTDVYFEGKAVENTQRLFVKIWNQQIEKQKLSYKRIVKVKVNQSKESDGRAMIIDHEPKAKGDQHGILLTMMKTIRSAEKSVDIENAYVVVFPSLINEIKAAVKRGVRVRVLTNSTDSVDEKVVALPIVRSAQMLFEVGAEVYLKKNSTLHSKFMIIDNKIFIIGSYNLHPRSEKMEGETVVLFDNEKLANQAQVAFENDIKAENATRLTRENSIAIPITGETLLPLRMFFDQL